LLFVLSQFIMFGLTRSKGLTGTLSLGLIIVTLVYGCIYRNLTLLKNKQIQIIFKGVDIIPTVTFGLLFGVATVLGTIFWQHVIIPLFGFSFIAFSTYAGLKFIVFDHGTKTIDGLFETGDTTFENLVVSIHASKQIEIKTIDKGYSLILKKEMYRDSVWHSLVENFHRMKS